MDAEIEEKFYGSFMRSWKARKIARAHAHRGYPLKLRFSPEERYILMFY